MVINYALFMLLFFLFFIAIYHIAIKDGFFFLFNKVYGHGLSRDESPPFDISGRQIAIEGILEPPFLNEGNQKPTLLIRSHDEKTNETLSDINYRIIANFKDQTIMDQRFHSLDGVVLANLIPSNESSFHEITSNNEEEKQQQQNLSKKDRIEVSLKKPVTIKSKLHADGGLYDISVILEKTSKGIKLNADKKVELFISIGKTYSFIIQESSHNTANYKDKVMLKVKTFYDEIEDFVYDQNNSKITFKMPFTWNLDYVSQIVNLHEELIIPKSYTPLSTVSSFTGTLNGMEILRNTILIDDYSNENNRIVHIVIPNFKLKEFTNQIIQEGGESYAFFELEPIKN
jgi:hypothetical protein